MKPGDILVDNDPRMNGRQLIVTKLLPNGVMARDAAGRERAYTLQRIFADGKSRRYGLNLVRGGGGAAHD